MPATGQPAGDDLVVGEALAAQVAGQRLAGPRGEADAEPGRGGSRSKPRSAQEVAAGPRPRAVASCSA